MSVRVTRSNPTGVKVLMPQDTISSKLPMKKVKMAGRGKPAKAKPAKVIEDNNAENNTVTDTKGESTTARNKNVSHDESSNKASMKRGRGRPSKGKKQPDTIVNNNSENNILTDITHNPPSTTVINTDEVQENTAKKVLLVKEPKTGRGRPPAKQPSTPVLKNNVEDETTADSKNEPISNVQETQEPESPVKVQKAERPPKKRKVVVNNNSTDNNSYDKMESPAKKSKLAKKGRPPKKQTSPESDDSTDNQITAKNIYDFSVNNIKGEPISLSKYRGNVCLIVNVASRCGHTKSNYQQLVDLHKKYADAKGLKILAFPCNQFACQEPGSPETICKFVEKYGVEFDMFDKVNVNGPKADPLFKYLCSKLVDPKTKANNIKWNFAKFIINKEGIPVERFVSSTKPISLVNTLEKYW